MSAAGHPQEGAKVGVTFDASETVVLPAMRLIVGGGSVPLATPRGEDHYRVSRKSSFGRFGEHLMRPGKIRNDSEKGQGQ